MLTSGPLSATPHAILSLDRGCPHACFLGLNIPLVPAPLGPSQHMPHWHMHALHGSSLHHPVLSLGLRASQGPRSIQVAVLGKVATHAVWHRGGGWFPSQQ